MTQESLAKRAKVARHHLSAIERGCNRPNIHTAYWLAKALDWEMAQMVRECGWNEKPLAAEP